MNGSRFGKIGTIANGAASGPDTRILLPRLLIDTRNRSSISLKWAFRWPQSIATCFASSGSRENEEDVMSSRLSGSGGVGSMSKDCLAAHIVVGR